ncbi:MAG: flagellar FliJ family protein [Gammaproteobacteria bacterium]
MKNEAQVKMIHKNLMSEKDGFLFELSKINKVINQKMATIQKMLSYQHEYLYGDHLKLSKTNPTLSKNLHLFTKQIDDVVKQAQMELDSIKSTQSYLLKKIADINKKIELMNVFHKRINDAKVDKEKRAEQSLLDDLSGTLHLRGNHD